MNGVGGELPDRDDRPDERQRRDDRVDARAVGQAGIDPRARLVDAPADGGDDPVDDPEDVLVVQEGAIDALDLPAPLDVDLVRAVDHDLGDRVVGEEGLERPEAADLADQLLDQAQALVARDREPIGADDPVDDRPDPGLDVGRRRGVEQRGGGATDLVLEALPDPQQQLLAGRGLGSLRGGRDEDGYGGGRGLRRGGWGRCADLRHGAVRARIRSAGLLDGLLLRPLDPLEQRQDVHLPRRATSSRCGDPARSADERGPASPAEPVASIPEPHSYGHASTDAVRAGNLSGLDRHRGGTIDLLRPHPRRASARSASEAGMPDSGTAGRRTAAWLPQRVDAGSDRRVVLVRLRKFVRTVAGTARRDAAASVIRA